MTITVKDFFDHDTATFTFVIHDTATLKCAIIDSVLDFNFSAGKTSTTSADTVISYVESNNLSLEWILETHIHADHLTAAAYIQKKLGGKIAIGKNIKDVLDFWVPIFDVQDEVRCDGSCFDVLLEDNQTLTLGESTIRVMYTPGHTPACVCYHVDDCLFVGDTIFMPDLGTARTDFPGGSAGMLYDSIQKIYALPDSTKIYVGHDYPPQGRNVQAYVLLKEQKEKNTMVTPDVLRQAYVEMREEKDKNKPVPRLLLPSIQVNMCAGRKLFNDTKGMKYLKIPLNVLPG